MRSRIVRCICKFRLQLSICSLTLLLHVDSYSFNLPYTSCVCKLVSYFSACFSLGRSAVCMRWGSSKCTCLPFKRWFIARGFEGLQTPCKASIDCFYLHNLLRRYQAAPGATSCIFTVNRYSYTQHTYAAILQGFRRRRSERGRKCLKRHICYEKDIRMGVETARTLILQQEFPKQSE